MSLVLLRLAVGWHFFMEGVEKYTDPNFSSAGFLLQAKGPLAEFYHNKVPQVHGWRALLAVPPDSDRSDEARAEEIRQWQTDYEERRVEAREADQPEPFEVQPHLPYTAWATQIAGDWRAVLDRFTQLPEVTDEHADAALAALAARRTELMEYLEQIEPEIVEFQRELARVRAMSKRDEVDEVPYYGDRIQSLENDAMRTPQPWLAEVTAIENAYFDDLREIYASARQQAEQAQADPQTQNASVDSGMTASQTEADGSGQSASPPPAGNEANAAGVEEGADDREGMPPEPPAEADAQASDSPVADSGPATVASDSPTPDADATTEASADDASPETGPSSDTAAVTGASDEESPADEEEEPMTLERVFIDDKAAELAMVDKVVTWLTLGVGACLVVGLFVPLAGFAGAIFLGAVISTQPPWVAGAQETYYQFIEMFSLLVLACTCAGRWAGLDYFFALLFSRGGRSQ